MSLRGGGSTTGQRSGKFYSMTEMLTKVQLKQASPMEQVEKQVKDMIHNGELKEDETHTRYIPAIHILTNNAKPY